MYFVDFFFQHFFPVVFISSFTQKLTCERGSHTLVESWGQEPVPNVVIY